MAFCLGYPPKMKVIAEKLCKIQKRILALPLSCFRVSDLPFLNDLAADEFFDKLNDEVVLERFQNILRQYEKDKRRSRR